MNKIVKVRDVRISAFFKEAWTKQFAIGVYQSLRIDELERDALLSGINPSTEEKREFEKFDVAVQALVDASPYSIRVVQSIDGGMCLRMSHDKTGMGVRLTGELKDGLLENVASVFSDFEELAMRNQNLESLTFLTLPFDNYGLRGYNIPNCVAPFHVHCYKAAYRRDYYPQFISREDMLRLPAYRLEERPDGGMVTQIYPNLLEGESEEALDYMKRCAWHFDKYHKVYGSTIYTEPVEWAAGGFFYDQERRLFGPNGLDGVVPKDLGLL